MRMKARQFVTAAIVTVSLVSVLFAIRSYNRRNVVLTDAQYEQHRAEERAATAFLHSRRSLCETGTMVEIEELSPPLYVFHDYPYSPEIPAPELSGDIFAEDLRDANTVMYILSATENAVGSYSKTGSQAYGFGLDICLLAKDKPAAYRMRFGAAPPEITTVNGPGSIRSVALTVKRAESALKEAEEATADADQEAAQAVAAEAREALQEEQEAEKKSMQDDAVQDAIT